MQLAMRIAREGRNGRTGFMSPQPSFSTTLAFQAGYSRHLFERRLFQSITESGLPFDVALIPEADTSAHLVFLTADFVKLKKNDHPTESVSQIKCVVFDLDNTLWDGVLVEGEDIRLKPDVVQLIEYFDSRGILLSIASKNDFESTWSCLERLGVAQYFLYPQINWGQKSDGIRLIAKSLNIGLDALAFVDDNPFELDEVARSLPMVACVPSSELHTLPGNPRFQGSSSADARSRRTYYRQAIQREEKQAQFGDDYVGFLASCEIELEMRHPEPDDAERIAELVQRTNQLNFSGRKYSRHEVTRILEDRELEKIVLSCSDKYGAYGTIGFAIIRHCFDEIRVEDLMLSCRVQGKFIEQSLFNHLLEHHNPHSANHLWVNYTETGRNTPAKRILESLHFQPSASGKGLVLDLSSPTLRVRLHPGQVFLCSCCSILSCNNENRQNLRRSIPSE